MNNIKKRADKVILNNKIKALMSTTHTYLDF